MKGRLYRSLPHCSVPEQTMWPVALAWVELEGSPGLGGVRELPSYALSYTHCQCSELYPSPVTPFKSKHVNTGWTGVEYCVCECVCVCVCVYMCVYMRKGEMYEKSGVLCVCVCMCTFTFTFMHLADSFIQSDFQERVLQKCIGHWS